jgi:putative ABC transport system permease protein
VIWTTILMAFREIRRNTMRSILTALGVVIGVGAVIAMVHLGESATQKVTSDVAKLGNNMLTLMPGAQQRGPGGGDPAPSFKLSDVEAIKKQIPQVSEVAPSSSSSALLVYGNKNHSAQVQGSTLGLFKIRDLTLETGRFFTEAENQGGSAVCVIGHTVQKELFGSLRSVGEAIRVGKMSCQVVGVLATKGQSTLGTDQDDFIVMPLLTFQRRMSGSTDISAIYISAKTPNATDRVKSQLLGLMRERRRIAPGQADNFSVMDMKEFATSLSSITGALTALLGGIAAVSLLVGGIGIMNIMLVSVTERTREIGIRLAIGARAHEVLLQFLVEAVLLSTIGGVIGILLGLAGSWAGARALNMPFSLSPSILTIAFFFSASVGIAFGFFPARRAARLKPIDALRHE